MGKNIRMDLTELGWEGMEWICLAGDSDQWRDNVNTDEPLGSI